MVRIHFAESEVGIHLSSSVRNDPVFSFNSWASDSVMPARGALTMIRPGDPEKAVVYIDRRHLDNLIDTLTQMKADIDRKEAEKEAKLVNA